MSRLVPSSVGDAISRGDTRASDALASSSRASEAHSARSSNVLGSSSSIAWLRKSLALSQRAHSS